jgi:hypothetical protein
MRVLILIFWLKGHETQGGMVGLRQRLLLLVGAWCLAAAVASAAGGDAARPRWHELLESAKTVDTSDETVVKVALVHFTFFLLLLCRTFFTWRVHHHPPLHGCSMRSTGLQRPMPR